MMAAINPKDLRPQPIDWLNAIEVYTADSRPPKALTDLYKALLGL